MNSLVAEHALYTIASRQGGYFTAAQAREVGYSYRLHHYHTQRGTWLKVDYGIYRLRDYPHTEREDLIRLALWSHNRQGKVQAVASHDTALSIHNMSDLMPSRSHLTVPKRGFRKDPPQSVVLHRANLPRTDIEDHTGYRVTTPLRTLIDVAESPLSQEHIDGAVRDALDLGLLRRRQIEEIEASDRVRFRVEVALMHYDEESK